ncbi:unnamed protein product [Durusdinium trenchii]|uniref:Coatomer subunit epsilon n=1 Tax=Durusdinium trenchii TaxID=1381693 RepID=A0ABP0KPB3_9DINO
MPIDREGTELSPVGESISAERSPWSFARFPGLVMADGPSAQGAVQLKESEEKMNLESFLNYVAFNKKAQVQVLDLSEANAEKANAEAQMVLRGALNFKRVDVAKELYEQLAAANVDIFSATFSLMIEASVLAKDLKTSSDFLMKMESSGHSPSSELLDKVLDLYSNQKTQREQVKNKSSNKEDEIISGATEKEAGQLRSMRSMRSLRPGRPEFFLSR